MYKKLILMFALVLLTGCNSVNLSNKSIEESISSVITDNDFDLHNKNNVGYKYYVPRNFTIYSDEEFNQTLINEDNRYYLYIDVLSYYNKVKVTYEANEDIYYGSALSYEDKSGFVEVVQNNSYFYIKMMYNYGIIEVRVRESEIKDAVVYMATILNSIKYNDSVIDNLINENILKNKEKTFELVGPKNKTDNKTYLDYLKEYDDYDGFKTDVDDTDLINWKEVYVWD